MAPFKGDQRGKNAIYKQLCQFLYCDLFYGQFVYFYEFKRQHETGILVKEQSSALHSAQAIHILLARKNYKHLNVSAT